MKKNMTMKKNAMRTIATPTSCTQKRRKGSKTAWGSTRKQMQTKTKTIRGCNNGEEVCEFEEHDDDHYYSHLLHIREEKGEQDHKGR